MESVFSLPPSIIAVENFNGDPLNVLNDPSASISSRLNFSPIFTKCKMTLSFKNLSKITNRAGGAGGGPKPSCIRQFAVQIFYFNFNNVIVYLKFYILLVVNK